MGGAVNARSTKTPIIPPKAKSEIFNALGMRAIAQDPRT
jgi:hypothetical protein